MSKSATPALMVDAPLSTTIRDDGFMDLCMEIPGTDGRLCTRRVGLTMNDNVLNWGETERQRKRLAP